MLRICFVRGSDTWLTLNPCRCAPDGIIKRITNAGRFARCTCPRLFRLLGGVDVDWCLGLGPCRFFRTACLLVRVSLVLIQHCGSGPHASNPRPFPVAFFPALKTRADGLRCLRPERAEALGLLAGPELRRRPGTVLLFIKSRP